MQTVQLRGYLTPINCTDFSKNIQDILCEIEFIKKGRNEQIANVPAVIDIEASSFYEGEEKRCCMYAWVFGLNGRCIRGRTWGELFEALEIVKRHYSINAKKRLIIYIHNLGYEFQFMRKYFEWEKIFSVDDRKPLYAITKCGIEFRCSYLLSGYSLEVLGKNLTKYKVDKKVGDLDYKLLRHSKTPLTQKEWRYILNDALVVMAHIQEEIERLGTIKDIPLTKTGYVRNLCREKCLKGEDKFDYYRLMRVLTLDVNTYRQLKQTYMGGFTHANSDYIGQEVRNVGSFDFTSSYPSVMIAEKYPMSKPHKVVIKNKQQFEHFLNGFCCMFECKFYNIRPKVTYENYISLSKCYEAEHYVVNNGRIVEASMIKIALTEQDFFIIQKMYEWDYIDISNFYYFYKAYLPKPIIRTILDLYKDKTELKGVEEKIVEYLVSKGMINALYGMAVTDPCKDDIIYDGEWKCNKADLHTLIEKYNKSNQRFLYYPWGVWVTAYARRNLFTGILNFKDDYIYSDTDSIKVINYDKHIDYINQYNRAITKMINDCLKHYNIDISEACPKTIKGVPKPLGVWDFEGVYDRFKTLGAKRYMFEQDGKISITIAGVGKEAGVEYLYHKYQTNDAIFKAFNEDLYFPPNYISNGVEKNGSGKLCHTYIDVKMEGYLIDYMGVEYMYNEYSGVHLENTDYTLSLDEDFIRFLLGKRCNYIV